jgi:hypothetical protein
MRHDIAHESRFVDWRFARRDESKNAVCRASARPNSVYAARTIG